MKIIHMRIIEYQRCVMREREREYAWLCGSHMVNFHGFTSKLMELEVVD